MLVDRPNRTAVDGLTTGSGFDLTQQIMRARLANFPLIEDAAIRAAQGMMMRDMHTLAEGAGAAAIAGLVEHRELFAGCKVAVVCTGGNASEGEIQSSVAASRMCQETSGSASVEET